MGITKRLGNLARVYLNSALNDLGIRSRKREEPDEAFNWNDFFQEREGEDGEKGEKGGKNRRRSPWMGEKNEEIAQYYAQLEIPYGSDLQTVKKAWRKLIRKYHPDLHANEPANQQIAHDLTAKLTKAYRELEKYLQNQEKRS